MFHSVVSFLMLCSLGAHTVLGCCWHHAHEEDLHASTEADIQPAPHRHHGHVHLGRGHHHSPGSDEEADDHSPHPHHPQDVPCCELPCHYVTSAPTKLPLPELHWQGGVEIGAPASVFSCDFADSDTRRLLETASPPDDGSAGIRARTQVYLL